MINSVVLYLFLIAAIGTLFGFVKQVSSFKAFSSHLFVAAFIFSITFVVSFLGLFAHTEEIAAVQRTVIDNLLPAMLFLIFTDLDLKTLFREGNLGCSCNIGPKRYWFLLLLSFVAALISQSIALHVKFIYPIITASLTASLLGFLISYTPVKRINGIQEIAATMLYLLAAIAGSAIL